MNAGWSPTFNKIKPSLGQQALHLLDQETVQACKILLTLASGAMLHDVVFEHCAPDHFDTMCEADKWHVKGRLTTQSVVLNVEVIFGNMCIHL